ncbi:LysR family transcriptional regulator [Achromobacter insuavis]
MTTSISAHTLFNRLMAATRLRHLQLVLQVAELGSVQQAARRLNISQSAATKLLADVERVLDTPLFERHARGMRPTFVCRDVLPALRNVMTMLTACAESAASAGAGIEGTIRVGAISAGLTGILNPVLPAFLASQPQARVELVEVP